MSVYLHASVSVSVHCICCVCNPELCAHIYNCRNPLMNLYDCDHLEFHFMNLINLHVMGSPLLLQFNLL